MGTHAMVLLPILVLILALTLLIPVGIGIYVYRDARARHMDAVLWTAIALLVPSFIGLIIYFFVRNDYKNQVCSRCGQVVSSEYMACPYCGQMLRKACAGCGTPVQSDWKVCPRCAAPLPEGEIPADMEQPAKKETWIYWLIGLLVGIPVLLLLIAILAFSIS